MHDGALALQDLTWREIVENHHSSLVDELSRRLDSDLKRLELEREEAVASALAGERYRLKLAIDELSRSQAEEFNQSLRRLRQANGEEHILRTLSESCSAYAEMLVVLVFENNQARVASSHGVGGGEFSFDIVSAAAVITAIDSRDPVIALATDAELSAGLAEKFRAEDDVQDSDASQRNAYLFPLTARHSVVAMLIASGRSRMISPPIELLCEAAGMRLETLLPSSDRAPAFDVPKSTSAGAERLTWEALSPEDQKLHLRAQRMARVRIAEIRLDNEADLRNGVACSDIYSALQPVIDAARNQFLHEFLAKSPTMVDYLHLEILSSLAHDDDRFLGHNYPGPMV